jgi:hypothetical protein
MWLCTSETRSAPQGQNKNCKGVAHSEEVSAERTEIKSKP